MRITSKFKYLFLLGRFSSYFFTVYYFTSNSSNSMNFNNSRLFSDNTSPLIQFSCDSQICHLICILFYYYLVCACVCDAMSLCGNLSHENSNDDGEQSLQNSESDLILSEFTDADFYCNTNSDAKDITNVPKNRTVKMRERRTSLSLLNLSLMKTVKKKIPKSSMILLLLKCYQRQKMCK